jgi:hypothetical protein
MPSGITPIPANMAVCTLTQSAGLDEVMPERVPFRKADVRPLLDHNGA